MGTQQPQIETLELVCYSKNEGRFHADESYTHELPFFEDGFDAESHEEWVLKEAFFAQLVQIRSLEKLSDSLCALVRYYEQESNRKKAEEFLLDLTECAKNNDVIFLSLSKLVQLYKNYKTQHSQRVITYVDNLLSDARLPVAMHWQIVETKAELYFAWKDAAQGSALLHELASQVKASDIGFWTQLQLKLFKLLCKAKNYWGAESYLWDAFEHLRNISPTSEATERVLEVYLRFTRNVIDASSDIVQTHAFRLFSISEYLKFRSSSLIRRVITAFFERKDVFADAFATFDAHFLLTHALTIVQPKFATSTIEVMHHEISILLIKHVPSSADLSRKLQLLSLLQRSGEDSIRLSPSYDGIRYMCARKEFDRAESVYVHLRNSYRDFGQWRWDATIRRLYS